MIYTFFSSVFITLALVLGALSLYGFLELSRANYLYTWRNYRNVIVLAIIAALCLIAAVFFGLQIPDCYAPTQL